MTATEKLKQATGLVKRPVTVPEMIDAWKPQIAKALMGTALNPERMGRIALTAFRKTPKLSECKPESVWAAIIISAQLGLELGIEAHLIPFKDECTLIVDYKGYIQLAYRSAHIKSIQADVVYSNDTFKVKQGSKATLDHEIDYSGARGVRVAAYAIAETATGGEVFCVMTLADIEKVRDRSSNVRNAKKYGKQTPWDTDTDEMMKKTVIRRLSKSLPRSAQDRLQQAVALDNAADQGGQGLSLDTINPDGDLLLSIPENKTGEARAREIAGILGTSDEQLQELVKAQGDWDKVVYELEPLLDREV